MTLDVKFEEQSQTFDADFNENEQTLNVDFGELQTVGGGGSGENGATFIPNVSNEGVISWTNDKGLENPTPVNIKGAKGDKGDRGAQGLQGVQGEKGKDGANGQDGFSPIVAVTDIEGGHRVTITDKDGAKTFEVMDGKDGVGGSGGGSAIIDVVALPTENIDEDSFYRLLTGEFYYNGTPQGDWTCYVVESLPQEGEPVTTDMVHVLLYYSIDNGGVYGYINSALSGAVGVPIGWYTVEVLGQAFGLAWGGIIWDEHEDPVDGANRLLLSYSLYQYKRDWDNLSERVGWRAKERAGAEIFNTLMNIATGNTSHAEGLNTTASGNNSHAEGWNTTASGNNSHAEGWNTTASGIASHAEGHNTEASGDSSHAEGWNTTASGDSSHAEGRNTTASGDYQHVQGKFNIRDDTDKYAHIVGNGTNIDNRSNAHTLDWNGLGWFAGGLKVGGTGQDDPNAEEILTKSQVQAMIDNAIANLPIYNGEVEEV